MPLIRLFGHALALLLALGAASAAQAICTTSSPSVTFTAGSSYDVQSNAIPGLSSAAGLSCSSPTLSVLGASYAHATMTSGNGFVLSNGSDTIPYQVSPFSDGSQPFTQNGTFDYMNPAFLVLLGILNGTNLTPMIYLKLTGAPNVSAGTYSDTLTINWSWKVCNSVLAGLCVGYETGTSVSTIPVKLIVGQDCRISAPDVSFGSAPLVSQFPTVSQAVLVDCTKNSTYYVAFTSGSAGNARPWRTMNDGAGHLLQYNLYRTDGTTIWDETNPMQSASQGAGTTTPSQPQAYKVRINPAQITPAAGHYQDQVSVVVSF